MGYLRGLVHGTVVGTVVGLCLAPQTGKKTREQLSSFGSAARDGYGVAQKTVRQVAPLAGAAAAIVRRNKPTIHSETEDIFSDSNVRIHNETNGHSD